MRDLLASFVYRSAYASGHLKITQITPGEYEYGCTCVLNTGSTCNNARVKPYLNLCEIHQEDLVRINRSKSHQDFKKAVNEVEEGVKSKTITRKRIKDIINQMDFDIYARTLEGKLLGGLDENHDLFLQVLESQKELLENHLKEVQDSPTIQHSDVQSSTSQLSKLPIPQTSQPVQPVVPNQNIKIDLKFPEPPEPTDDGQWIRFYATRHPTDHSKVFYTAWMKHQDNSSKIFSAELAPNWKKLNRPVWVPSGTYFDHSNDQFTEEEKTGRTKFFKSGESVLTDMTYFGDPWLGYTCSWAFSSTEYEAVKELVETLKEVITVTCIGVFRYDDTQESPKSFDPFFCVEQEKDVRRYRTSIHLTESLFSDENVLFQFPKRSQTSCIGLEPGKAAKALFDYQLSPASIDHFIHICAFKVADLLHIPALKQEGARILRSYQEEEGIDKEVKSVILKYVFNALV